jgi:hypothetical protein
MMNINIKEKNLHLVEKRDVLSYTLEEFNAMDEARQMETLWLQLDVCLEEIKNEKKVQATEHPVEDFNNHIMRTPSGVFPVNTSSHKISNHH